MVKQANHKLSFFSTIANSNLRPVSNEVEENSVLRFLLLCGVWAPVMISLIIIIAGRLTPHYNAVTDTVSRIGIPGQPYADVLHGGYFFYGALMSLGACGLYLTLSPSTAVNRLANLICIHAIGTIFLAFFPDSLISPVRHIIHDIVSVISYLPLLISMLLFYGIGRRDGALKTAGILGIAVCAVNLPMPVINMLGLFKPVSGLLQRLMSGSSFLWLAVTYFVIRQKNAPGPGKTQPFIKPALR